MASTFSLLTAPTPPSTSFSRRKFSENSSIHLSSNLQCSFLGETISLRPSKLIFHAPKRCIPALATIALSLPLPEVEKAAPEKTPKWSARSIRSFALCELEARKLKYPKTGTEAILMGVLVEGTSLAAKFLRQNGITLSTVRDKTFEVLGKSNANYYSPGQPPLTEQARRALQWAVDEKLKSGDGGEITATYLVLAIWSVKESAGHKILAELDFDDQKATELARNKDKDYEPGKN